MHVFQKTVILTQEIINFIFPEKTQSNKLNQLVQNQYPRKFDRKIKRTPL